MQYEQIRSIPAQEIKTMIEDFLREDMPEGDVTTQAIFSGKETTRAVVEAQENLVVAGSFLYPFFFGDGFEITIPTKEGEEIKKGEPLAQIVGPTAQILSRERVLLNLLQRMCGIAGMARQYARIAQPYGVKILDTRKTTPGLRRLEKYAVKIGGGFNHRLNLSTGILIKDNHIQAAGGITNAINQVRNRKSGLPLEVEVETLIQVKEGLAAGVDGFLLDNMTPQAIVKIIETIRSAPSGKNIFVEASGGITLETLEDYLKTGVDAISVGALTHSVKSADIHLIFPPH